MYQAKSGVKNFSLYLGGGSLDKKFFFQSEHVSSQIWCQKFFPLLRPGTPPDLRLGPPHLDLGPPLSGPGPGSPPYLDLGPPPIPRPGTHTLLPRPGTPPLPGPETGYPPPVEVWTDTQNENITFPILRMRAVRTDHRKNPLESNLQMDRSGNRVTNVYWTYNLR